MLDRLISVAAGRALLVLVVLCGVASFANAQETAGPSREAIERGRTTYRQYCSACHGNNGRGDAPGAGEMKPRPTNLTRLTRQYGTFPAERIDATLKGSDQTKAHSSAMMVWRAFFLADAKGDEAVANVRVKDVTAFLASIQSK
jgi:mono/diheme cytochrome c family protein